MKTNFNKNLFSSKSDDFANKYLNHFLQFSIKSAADYDEENKWITNSKQIKNLTELKGIINLNKSNGKYIKKSDCNSRHPLLNVNHSFNTERTAAKIVDNFDILLKYSNRIVFVDRYFDITKSYCTNIINEIKSRILHYHTEGSINLAFCISKEKYDDIILEKGTTFFNTYFSSLRSELMNHIDVYTIEEKYLHNRFILSAIASWQGGNGLSDNSNNGGVADDDFTPMDYKHYEKRLSDLTSSLVSNHYEFK